MPDTIHPPTAAGLATTNVPPVVPHPLPPLVPDVTLHTPAAPNFAGAYARVSVTLAPGSGLTLDDLEFHVPQGPKGGSVSPSRDALFSPAQPNVMLLYGFHPGTYTLQAVKKGTTAVLAEGKFAVTDRWPDKNAGPPLWFNGLISNYAPSPTWGGGASGSPQNINVAPATGSRRIGVLFVDTTDQRYTTAAPTLAGFQSRWQNHIINGVAGTDGVTRSVRQYYREVSYNAIDVSAQVFATVVHLPGPWMDYFDLDANGLWRYLPQYHKQCMLAAGDSFDFTQIDLLVCAMQNAGTTGTSPKIAWPYGGRGSTAELDTSHGHVSVHTISMPNEWGDGSAADQSAGTDTNLADHRTIYETLCHEMGHTLSLPDEYTPAVAGRNLGSGVLGDNTSWDPMDWECPLPHFCLTHRMMLGWVQAPWLKLYDFQALGSTVDETVTLHAIELGAPPAGRFAGIEVRVGDGRNYYFEYRAGQSAEVGDDKLTPNGRVVGTDVSEPPDPPVTTRPDILLLPRHADDTGAVLDAGQFYHELDSTSPTFPSDFRVDVVSRDGTSARIRVRYEVIGKPDPSIRPWPRDADHQWQSPDIEVRNPRATADPASWANVPWLGHDNTVVAHVTNRGTLSAPGVAASFFVKDYTVGGAPESFLGSDTHDVAPGASVEFTTLWNPPAPADPAHPLHFCIIVRIAPYQTPTSPPVPELTDANNVAQSNYDRFISASQSPPSREITSVAVGNPYDKPALFFLSAGQTNPLYRTYLEHTWVRLHPHETRRVQVMFEYAPDAPQLDPRVQKTVQQSKERFQRLPNTVGVIGMIDDPHDKRLHGPSLLTGVTAQVVQGRGTKFRDFVVNVDGASGSVVFADDDRPVPGGTALVMLNAPGHREQAVSAKVGQGGFFRAQVPPDWKTAEATYVPLPGLGECTSAPVSR